MKKVLLCVCALVGLSTIPMQAETPATSVTQSVYADEGYLLQTVYQSPYEAIDYVCQSPILIFNLPIASSFVVEGKYVKSFVIPQEEVWSLYIRNKSQGYWDLKVQVESGSTIYNGYIRFVFVD